MKMLHVKENLKVLTQGVEILQNCFVKQSLKKIKLKKKEILICATTSKKKSKNTKINLMKSRRKDLNL